MLTALISPVLTVLGWVKDYVGHRQEITKAKREAQIAIIQKETEAIYDADTQSVIDQKSTWKDEYITLIVTLPIVGCFIPGLAPYVKLGFETLKTSVPEWYVTIYAVVVLSVMGARMFHKYIMPKIGKK